MNYKTNVFMMNEMTSFLQLKFRLVLSGLILIAYGFLTTPALAQQANGQLLYRSMCASCHGADLRGGLGPNLIDDEWVHGSSRDDMVQIIREGSHTNGMPAFGASLSDEQVNRIIDYIENPHSETGTAPASAAMADTLGTLDYAINIEVFADGLEIPWAIGFLDPQTALITERPGRLRVVENGRLLPEPVEGTPEVVVSGHEWNQGGLLDVTVDPNYDENGWIYLSYSHSQPNPVREDSISAMTRIVRGRLNENQWVDQEVLFEAPAEMYSATIWHYGSRIVFDPEGSLYFSVGDRGAMDQAQDLSRPNGKIHRINPDGSIPADNPFVDREDAVPSIFSYGHRNPQGLTVNPATGEIWNAEHGPRGGDELNRVLAGRNYGWPSITYGIDYDGTILTPHRRQPGMEQPARYWRPSIAISGLAFYDGDAYPLWRNRLLVGALAYEELRLLNIEDDRVMHEEIILKDQGRVREAVVGPDGAIYVVLNAPDRVLRLIPREERLQ